MTTNRLERREVPSLRDRSPRTSPRFDWRPRGRPRRRPPEPFAASPRTIATAARALWPGGESPLLPEDRASLEIPPQAARPHEGVDGRARHLRPRADRPVEATLSEGHGALSQATAARGRGRTPQALYGAPPARRSSA